MRLKRLVTALIGLALLAPAAASAETFDPSTEFTLKAGETEAVARPSELLERLFGAEFVQPGTARLIRESVVFGPPAT